MPGSVTFKLIIVYYYGYMASVPPDDEPKCEVTSEPLTGEVPDGNGCYYIGLNTFQNSLNAMPSPLLTSIKARNEDVDDVKYLGQQSDLEGILRHQFEVTITPPDDSPIQVNVDQVEPGKYEWSADDDTSRALFGLLDRIFWTPPTPPRIRGRYTIERFHVTINGQAITGKFNYPRPGGIQGGGG